MSNLNKIKIYDLAREVKQDTKRIIEDLRREGADITMPSNFVSKEFAEKIRNRYFPRIDAAPKRAIKVIKKDTKKIFTLNEMTKGQEICEFCSATISTKNYDIHISTKCPKKPVLSNKRLRKLFDSMKDATNDLNKTNLSSIEFAHYLIDSQLVSNIEQDYSQRLHYYSLLNSQIIGNHTAPPDVRTFATVNNRNKRLKVLISKELFELDRLSPIDSYNFTKIHVRLVEVAKLHIRITYKQPEKYHDASSNNVPPENSKNKQSFLEVEEIFWEIFPRGDWFAKKEMLSKIYEHFARLQNNEKWKSKSFDKSRLKNIEEKMNPNKYFIGKDKFESYIVYCFNWTDKVILECPIYGNATYVIKSGEFSWKHIAKVSKWDARTEHSDQVTVINHSETWIERLEQNLRYGL